MIPDNYKGREHAFIKHTLLRSYIERLFMIVGQAGHQKTICFVDCFAGPWQEGTDDCSDTSIAISLDIMNKCRGALLKRKKYVNFRALFIEKKKKPYDKLCTFLKDNACDGVKAEAKHGDFFQLRDEILKWTGNKDFTFFFIDPTGWRRVVEDETLLPLLKRQNSEYLINFMYKFIRRTVPQSSFERHMIEIFGKVPDTAGMSPDQKETYLLKLYLTHLKKIQGSSRLKPRAAKVRVLDPIREETIYYLIYLTRHPKGIVVFMDASEKLDLIQRQVRAETKQNHRVTKSGQLELLPADAETNHDYTGLNEVKEYWLSKLTGEPKRFDIETLADMLEETGWFESDFQKALRELIEEGKVKNIDATRKRSKNVVNFEKKERIKRVII